MKRSVRRERTRSHARSCRRLRGTVLAADAAAAACSVVCSLHVVALVAVVEDAGNPDVDAAVVFVVVAAADGAAVVAAAAAFLSEEAAAVLSSALVASSLLSIRQSRSRMFHPLSQNFQ